MIQCCPLERIFSSTYSKKIQEMERCITGVTGWQQPLCMTLKMNPFTKAAPAATVELRQFHRNCGGTLQERMPRQRMAGALLVKCESSHKNSPRSQRRSSRSLNQATSASKTRLAPVQTELELINDLCVGQGISDVLLELQKQKSHSQVLKVSIELCKKEYFVVPKSVAESDLKFWDEEDERRGKKVRFRLVSVEVDPVTGRPKQSTEVAIEKWTEVDPENHSPSSNVTKFDINLKVEKDFGTPGALILKNFHRDEFFLKAVSVELPDESTVHFPCNSCVYNADQYAEDRVFFSNKVYLPQETPAGLKGLREEELINMRGKGSGLRKEADRIYDYDVYNDLGDSDQHASFKRPVLGRNDKFPYPRRMRTGRPPSEIDPTSEHRGEMYAKFYIPRDERVTLVKIPGLEQEDAIETASRKMMPALFALYSTQVEYQSMDQVFDLFRKGVTLSTDSKCASDPEPECESEAETVTFRLPKVVAAREDAWMHDEEFARQVLAGINPVAIERASEFPIRSTLDSTTYGNPVSAITAEHIEPFLEGLDVQSAVAERKLFVLDYHDIFLPFVNKINDCPTSKAYATRTLLFTRKDGTMIPVAIELSLPPCEGNNQPAMNRVVTPPSLGKKDWTWELAKTHVMANDAGYHQLISHWLRSHAAMEPMIIATHRQLSPLHPVHQALVHHFKDTLDINAAARKALVNAGGIIEKTFTPHEISMQMSSTWYKHKWRFDEQALPVDLLKRGMAIPDENAEHGIKLVMEDYPFAADGLEHWGAIQSWLSDYVEVIYKDDASVRKDEELRRWWTEIRTVGHGDKKDDEGWPVMDSKKSLIHILSIIVWTASCHHAAVNFGQYEYAGFMPNHPTMTRRLIPSEGTPEFLELQKDPQAFYLSTVSNETQATVIAITTEALSTHASHEEYLGQRNTPNWTNDDKILVAFNSFQRKIGQIEKLVTQRNQDKRLKHRNGPAQVPYELLHPSSEPGLTGKGVPNSASI